MSVSFASFRYLWSLFICGLILCVGTASLNAQTDSLTSTPIDSLSNTPLDSLSIMAGDSLQTDSLLEIGIDSIATDSIPSDSLDNLGSSSMPMDSLIQAMSLDTSFFPTKVDTPVFKRVVSTLEAQIPEIYKDSGQLRLHIPIFWREDIDLPLPKAFEKTGPRPPYDPTVAWQRSLILPGWGQVYNQDYWKLPIFYAGYAAGAVWIGYNHRLYLEARVAFLAKVSADPFDDIPEFERFDSEGIRRLRNEYRNRRDQGVLILAGWHLIQVAEAYVDAHMEGYDVSEDLSMTPFPTMIAPANNIGAPALGMGLKFSF
ncbi:MAG: DUF5683 domain-containing protein [Bacteroidota bacterium]